MFLNVLDGTNETPTTIELPVRIDEKGKELNFQRGWTYVAMTSDIKKLGKLLGKKNEELRECLKTNILRLLNLGGRLNTAETLTLAPGCVMRCIVREMSPEVSFDEKAKQCTGLDLDKLSKDFARLVMGDFTGKLQAEELQKTTYSRPK